VSPLLPGGLFPLPVEARDLILHHLGHLLSIVFRQQHPSLHRGATVLTTIYSIFYNLAHKKAENKNSSQFRLFNICIGEHERSEPCLNVYIFGHKLHALHRAHTIKCAKENPSSINKIKFISNVEKKEHKL
jgi:hypothetical protein